MHDYPADATAAPFVGLTVTVGYALLDTGAQTGLIGEAALQEMANNLKKFKLQPRWISTAHRQAGGVGGKALTIGEVEVPAGLGGVNGTLKFLVSKQSVPPLLPNHLITNTKSSVDYNDMKVHWRAFGRSSRIELLPSGHAAINIMGFAPGGWSPPDTVTYITDLPQTKDFPPAEADITEDASETEGVCFVDYQKIWSEIRSATADENGLIKIPLQQVQGGEVLVIASHSVAPAALATPEVRMDYGSFEFWSLAEQPRLQLPITEWEEASQDLPHVPDPSALAVLICYASETMYKKRDDWRELDDCWMRTHSVPRRSFFLPSMTTDGPLSEQLDGTRITHVCHVHDQSVRTFSDSSLSTADLMVLLRSWTGFSKFPKKRVQTEKTVRFAEPPAEQGFPQQPARLEPPQAERAEVPPLSRPDA